MGIIIPRYEINQIERISGWLLIYGRRKTGKSFLVRNFIDYDEYYFVSRTGNVYELSGNAFKPMTKDIFLDRIQRILHAKKTIVIDEFHRLSSEFQDLLHAIKPSAKARLILITSSLFFVEKILGPKSPLLGVVIPVRLDTISAPDIIKGLLNLIEDPRDLLTIALFAREPLLLDLIERNITPYSFLRKMLVGLKDIVPALIGEIFFEESRELTERYEAILKAMAVGNDTVAKIASYISGIIGSKLSSHDVKSYLRILERMGLVKRTKVFRKKKYLYTVKSPMIRLYFYLNEKIGYGEMDIPLDIALEEARKIIPRLFEEFVVELIAKTLQGSLEKTQRDEIDGIITRKKETIAVVEVKMGQITHAEVAEFVEKAEKREISAAKIVIANKKVYSNSVISLSFRELISIATNPEKLQALVKKYTPS